MGRLARLLRTRHIDAESPQEAAEKALAIQPKPESVASVFYVIATMDMPAIEDCRWEVNLTEGTVTEL